MPSSLQLKALFIALALSFSKLLCAAAPVNPERAKELSITTLGTRQIAGIAVPAFQIDSQTGLDLAPQDRKPGAVPQLKLSAKAAAWLQWVHLSGYGWLLLPKDWKVIDAGVGANGSMILVASGASGDWLEYYDTAASVGSALSAASCFYPQAQKLAIEYEMGQCQRADAPKMSAKAISPVQSTRERRNGEALQILRRYTQQPDVNFRSLRMHVSAPAPWQPALEVFFRGNGAAF
jgi:hypothetical protein